VRILRISFIVLAAASACGGKVALFSSGGAGGATTTGSTSTGATSTGSTSTGATSTGSTSTGATSTGATSTSSASSSSTGGTSQCPLLAPNDGDPCDAPGLMCYVALCCGGTATCDGAVWHVVENLCGHVCPAPCPGTTLDCDENDLCVNNPIGGGDNPPEPHYNCAENPCGAEPLSCACAGFLCQVGPCAGTSSMGLVGIVTCTTLAN
jgi:hypothetical protein